MIPPLARPERIAAASIRGYLYQTVGIALLWVSLDDDELLLCEGDEDADRFIVDPAGVVQEVTEFQFKDTAGALSARDEVVQETIFNFLRAYRHHGEQQRSVRFVFTSAAARARQQVHGSHKVSLAVDVLRTWEALPNGEGRAPAILSLRSAILMLVEAARPVGNDDGRARRDQVALEQATTYLNADDARWTDFIERVEWRFAAPTAKEMLGRLEDELRADARTSRLPSKQLAQQLVLTVLETSAESETSLRVLRRSDLDAIAGETEADLIAWSERTHADRFQLWVEAVDVQLEQLGEAQLLLAAELADHGRVLATHSDHLARNSPTAVVERRASRDARELASFASLPFDGREVRLEREILPALVDASLQGSLVLVGDPGSGKSGVLASLAAELTARSYAVKVFSADTARRLGDDLVDALEQSVGPSPAMLIVDALDSLRDDENAAALRQQLGHIVRANGRWRVIASIRTFDLYQGSAIASLFAGVPPSEFVDARVPNVRHIALGSLTNAEIAPLRSTAPRLYALVATAPSSLAELLRLPFNLSLAAQLLDQNTKPDDILEVRTQVELLDMYWRRRVGDFATAKEGREGLVRDLCAQMSDKHALIARKRGLDPARLAELLHLGVLREPLGPNGSPDDGRVEFSHHILFDYAFARFGLPDEAEDFAVARRERPRLLVFARPSIAMALERLWAAGADRHPFWSQLLRICGDRGIRAVGKIVGASVGAARAQTSEDVAPLVRALQDLDEQRSIAADETFGLVVGALLARPRDELPVAGAAAGPWAELAEVGASVDRSRPRDAARRLLLSLTEHPEHLTPGQLSPAGRGARALLDAALAQSTPSGILAQAVRFVCRTFRSAPAESASRIRRLVEPGTLERIGYMVLPALAGEVRSLLHEATLVATIYTAAFATRDESRAPTHLGGGQVMSFSANRKQDYDGGLYTLKATFPAFLEASVLDASRVLLGVLRTYVDREHSPHEGQPREHQFLWNDQAGILRHDFSEWWDGRAHVHELEMLDAWQNRLSALASDATEHDALATVFALCLTENRLAVVWSRWLVLASQSGNADVFGPLVFPLVANPAFLTGSDTRHAAGEALRVQFPHFDQSQRTTIEEVILAIRQQDDAPEEGVVEAARLLGCIDEQLLVTEGCKAPASDFRQRCVRVPNDRTVLLRRIEGGTEPDPDHWLRVHGVPLDEEPHRTVLQRTNAVEACREALSPEVNLDRFEAALDAAQRVVAAVVADDRVHPELEDHAWQAVAECVVRIASDPRVLAEPSHRARLVEITLAVHGCPSPRRSEQADQRFVEHGTWGDPNARRTIVDALIALAEAGDTTASPLLEQLSTDAVASVRGRVHRRLGNLLPHDPARVWRILQRAADSESVARVVASAIDGAAMALATLDEARLVALLGIVLARFTGDGDGDVRRAACLVLCALHLRRDESSAATAIVDACAARPRSRDASYLLEVAGQSLATGLPEDVDPERTRRRRRAQSLFHRIVVAAFAELEALAATPGTNRTTEQLEQARRLLERLEMTIRMLDHASGAFAARGPNQEPPQSSPRVLTMLLDELASTIEQLARVRNAAVAHHFIELLEVALPSEPRRVFLLIANAVVRAAAIDYQYDSLATTLIVRIAKRMLADYRALMQSDPAVHDGMLDVLDIFVAVGWPEPQELAYGLQDIFR